MKQLSFILTHWTAPIAAVCLIGGLLLGFVQDSAVPALIACGLALAASLLHRGSLRRLMLMALIVSVGALLGWHALHPMLPEPGEYQVTGVISDAVTQRDDRQVHTLLHHLTLNGQPYAAGAYWSFYADELPSGLEPGASVSFTAQLYHPSGAMNPGGYDFRLSLLQKGADIGLYGGEASLTAVPNGCCLWGVMAGWRHQLSQRLCQMLGSDAGAMASAMLLGERSLLPDEDLTAFRRLGIVHVLSVSGYHVGVLTALLVGLFRLLRVPRRWRLLPVGTVLAFYCMLTGMHPPVIRAALLILLAMYGKRLGALPVQLHWLAVSAILQLIVSPAQLLSASFQLTYSTLLGILLIGGWLRRYVLARHKQRWLSALCTALSAQLGLLLPQLYWFHELPLLGLAANLLLMSVFSVLMGMYWLCLPLMLLPGVSTVYGTVVAAASSAISSVLRWCSRTAGFMLWTRQANLLTLLGWLLMLIAVNRLWPRWGRRHLCAALTGVALMVLSVIPWPMHGVAYTQLSVGEADAAVLQDDSTVTVIDAGGGSTLASYLHARRLSIDTLILTHLHADHTGGVAALLESGIPIRRCILPIGAEKQLLSDNAANLLQTLSEHGVAIEHVTRGDVIPLSHGQLTVLWPQEGSIRSSQAANDYSLALLARLHQTTLLLTGDLSGTYETYAAVPADILKAAHHGAAGSTGEAFLQQVQPGIVLQSCGSDARVEGLRARLGGIPLYATQEHGAITLHIDENGCTIQPFLP